MRWHHTWFAASVIHRRPRKRCGALSICRSTGNLFQASHARLLQGSCQNLLSPIPQCDYLQWRDPQHGIEPRYMLKAVYDLAAEAGAA